MTTAIVQSYLETKSRIRICDLAEAKRRGEKWAMLTTYDATSAKIFDLAKIPCLLVGDSAAQMVYGYKSTLPITVDELIPLVRAVSTSSKRALVVADLPFGSYQESPQQALRSATRFMKESSAHAIKLEGGKEFSDHVKLLVQSGIPVMGHIGFTPQSEHALSGFKVQGRGAALTKLIDDATAIQRAGAFACVIELVPEAVGREVTESVEIPIIGIGAGPHCDAQVMVWNDMAGFTAPNSVVYLSDSDPSGSAADETQDKNQAQLKLDRVPKFVKRYANLSDQLYEAAIAYANDVRSGIYPAKEHCYD